LLYSLQQEEEKLRVERETPVSKAWWNSVMTHPFLNYIPEEKTAFLWLSPWRILDFCLKTMVKWVVAREKVKRAWWKWLQPLMTHPLLNYIPGQNPELHSWSDLDQGAINSEEQPKNPQFLVHLNTFRKNPQ
jgi:hypothetical protein